jgi:hypothetical protein
VVNKKINKREVFFMKKNNKSTGTAAKKEDNRANEIIRIQKKRNNFVMLDKGFIEDERLSFKAKGILTYLLSKPDGWKVIVKDIVKHAKDGERAVYSGLKELKQYGYYQKKPVRENGLIAYWESVVYECPHEIEQEPPQQPQTAKKSEKTPISPLLGGFVDVDNEDVENGEHNNIYINKNNLNNNDISIYQSKKNENDDNIAATPPIDMIDTTPVNNYSCENVADKIALTELKELYPDKQPEINLLYDCVCEVLTADNPVNTSFRIARQNISSVIVKHTFNQLAKPHIEYVLECLDKNGNKHKINKNTKSYFMTSLFNAPRTISYHSNQKFQKPLSETSSSDNELFEKLVRRSLNF